MKFKKWPVFALCFILCGQIADAQKDSSIQRLNIHFQQTVINQHKPAFHARYSGPNSLKVTDEGATSLTSTLFIGARLSKNTKFVFNPELAGGSGLSKAMGAAGFPNGETFRIGNPKPQAYVARAFIEQYFPLGEEREVVEDDVNQLKGSVPAEYVRVVAGRFSLADYFDNNEYSHDPRTQFLNWSLMSNGAWDYPANTRGYTWGAMLEYATKKWSLRVSNAMVPLWANGAYMDEHWSKANSSALEWEHSFKLLKQRGHIRLLGFYTLAHMGNYKQALTHLSADSTPSVILTRVYGRNKYGAAINIEQPLGEYLGLFIRASWNDGHNETWAFTEIDQSVSAGLLWNGKKWKRAFDSFGVALVSNGISKDHRDYLKNGGKGFMVGDGNLNYAQEMIAEVFYCALMHEDHFWITPDYQFILNPAYNRDRGPVHVFSLRVHVAF